MDKKEPRTTRRFALSVLRFALVAESEERTTNSSNRTNFGFREASWKLYLSVKSVKSVVHKRLACYVLCVALCVAAEFIRWIRRIRGSINVLRYLNVLCLRGKGMGEVGKNSWLWRGEITNY